MRLIICCFFFAITVFAASAAQRDSVPAKKDSGAIAARQRFYVKPDSATAAQANREQFIADSLAMIWLMPDPKRENKFLTSLSKNPFTGAGSFLNITLKKNTALRTGDLRTWRDRWLIVAIIGLLIYTGLLNLFLGKDVKIVIQSFYNKHSVSALEKEGGVINTWAFIGLFVLFSLTFGLVLYQLTAYFKVSYSIGGFQLFITLSVLISLLFALKFLVLKFIGFVFDVNKVVSEYIGILNLTYFNIAFVLLAVAICFSLISAKFIPGLLAFTLIAVAVIFAWQYLRNSVNIISNIRFHKFYLFIYLCALEICPILILIKALNI